MRGYGIAWRNDGFAIAEVVNQVERVLADGVDAVLLLSLFVAAVYSIGDRVLDDVDQKPRPLLTMLDEIFERILLGHE
jgi:hypothetical protein